MRAVISMSLFEHGGFCMSVYVIAEGLDFQMYVANVLVRDTHVIFESIIQSLRQSG